MASRWRLAAASVLVLALLACSSDEEAGQGAGGSSASGEAASGHGGSLSSVGSTGGTATGPATGSGGGPAATSGGGGTSFAPEVACDGAICEDATPICCVPTDGPRTCVAYMGSESCGTGSPTTMFCDELTDCLAGQVCCVNAAGATGPIYTCGYPPCPTHEACVPGGMCGQAGNVCTADPAQASGAKCTPG